MTEHREYDIIIAGGGGSGCVLAGRLSQADPSLSILVVEAGANNAGNPMVVTPGFFLAHLDPSSKITTFHVGKATKALNGRAPVVPSGGVLGGGTSIHFLMYTRPSESDLNDWRTPGWTAKDVVPLYTKCETYHIKEGQPNHGYDGPLHVSHGGHRTELAKEWVEVAKTFGGFPQVPDLQDLKTAHGVEFWAKWIDPATGLRSDSAHAYLHPEMAKNPNLQVLCGTKVKRVLFDGNRATGVEVAANKAVDPDAPSEPFTISARKLVVISAGACSTPLILQRSGIGPAELLKKFDVPVKKDLPGVGSSYLDHPLQVTSYKAADGTETYDALMRQEPETVSKLQEEFANHKGLLASSGLECGAKTRPSLAQVAEIGPAFRERWHSFFENATDKPVMVNSVVLGFVGSPTAVPRGSYFSPFTYLTHPVARGYCNITSGVDENAPADFDPGYLQADADVEALIWAYKFQREIARRLPSYRGEVAVSHPAYPETSDARARTYDDPLPGDVKDIAYTKEDDEAIDTWLRSIVQTCYHSAGTAAMRDEADGGVVDRNLNVYGTQALKVVDLSIMPSNVAANTVSTAFMIGEKAALIVAEELGLKAN